MGWEILNFIELILEIGLGIMFAKSFFRNDEIGIKRFGIALIIVLLCKIRYGQIQIQ